MPTPMPPGLENHAEITMTREDLMSLYAERDELLRRLNEALIKEVPKWEREIARLKSERFDLRDELRETRKEASYARSARRRMRESLKAARAEVRKHRKLLAIITKEKDK